MAKIFARVVIELAGFPKEHIEEVMKKIINKIKEGFEVSKLEIKFEDINTITVFCFEYMPSSIEIIEPEELRFKSTEVAGFLNDVLARLHEYDMVVKNLQAEKIVMKKKQENKQ